MQDRGRKGIGLWALALGVAALAIVPARAEDEAAQAPPLLQIQGSRTSTAWVTVPGGARVAVDQGVTWQGVTVYLSLTWDLVGVDATSGATLFATDVGAFWNTITFQQVTPTDGVRQWAIELRPDARRQAGAELRQFHHLRTGARLAVPALDGSDLGTPLELPHTASGDRSDIASPFSLLIGTAAGWASAQERTFGPEGERPALGELDFDTHVVLLVSGGDRQNCTAITLHAAYEDDARVLVRTGRTTMQTINGFRKARPWGAFVLPRRAAKAYVVERNIQGLIGGPAIWRTLYRVEGVPAPEVELAGLPPRTDVPYHGWEEEGSDVDGGLPPPKAPPR